MQREEKQLDQMLDSLIQRVTDLRNSIVTFIKKLETEFQTMSWPTVLDNFALLSGQLNSLHRLLKSDKVPALRNYALLPLVLSPERDPQLEKLTEGRVPAFNHEVVPDYLRTKPEPEVEEKIIQLTNRANTITMDNTHKQSNAMNKITSNILDIINVAKEEWETESSQKSTQPQTSSMADTTTLVAATSFGRGLKQRPRVDSASQQSTMANQQQQPQKPAGPGNVMGKAPSAIKTNIKAGTGPHPYNRP